MSIESRSLHDLPVPDLYVLENDAVALYQYIIMEGMSYHNLLRLLDMAHDLTHAGVWTVLSTEKIWRDRMPPARF